ncbi:hypothetical protein [Mesohalobacter halotolerans]|uniref:Uncharacterized protein n=1 Tax=Mesohalobacter halotolerans TaxID=1883405 RepID=A0A4U5TTN3_9FLAO|nr:hypothetical protein [Mesohalobacter halotolerans]MBS3739063.1 hypothetical protein [Psychroflexus sp.]TKS57442.1 hypothetical protein FCN74_03215 [Mesohalobacter halotolerans]
MNTPMMWANPNNLDLINDKREIERLKNHKIDKTVKQKNATKTKLIDILNKAFALRLKPNFEI